MDTLVKEQGEGGADGEVRHLKRKTAKEILGALRSERIAWESEPIPGETGRGMGRPGEGRGEVSACIQLILFCCTEA